MKPHLTAHSAPAGNRQQSPENNTAVRQLLGGMQTAAGTWVLREQWTSAVHGCKRAIYSLSCGSNSSRSRQHRIITRSDPYSSPQHYYQCHLAVRHRFHGSTTSPKPSSIWTPRLSYTSLSRGLPLGGPRRFSSDPGTGEGSGVNERERFVVTGSLLEARRAGADSPLPGQFLSVSHAFGPDAVAAFANHAGDVNPIHLDQEYARHAGPRSYEGCIVHGLMVAGLFPTAFGRAIPGALYVSQSLRFERPVLVGESVDARVEVEKARVTSSGREVLVRCSTTASLADGTVAVSGQAKVLLPRSCDVRSW